MDKQKFKIRNAILDDLPEMQTLFVDTITAICKHDYTPEQIAVWIVAIENTEKWADKIKHQYFLIAEFDNKIVGYASLENNDYIDLLYIHKDFQRQGIANVLFNEIEKEALKQNTQILKSDVSITVRPFFESKGFVVNETQKNYRKGVEIINFQMSKLL
jgi:putative acetyltransferase